MLKYKVIMKNQSEKMLDGVLTAVMDSDSDVPADSLTLTCPYDSEIRLHGDRLKVLDADKLVFTGQLDNISVIKRGSGVILKLNARSKAAELLDNEAEPVTYINPSASLIESRHLRPFGITLSEVDNVPYYNKFKIDKGMSHWQVLRNFCRNRYQCEPRISGDGTAYMLGVPNGGSVVFSDGGDGITYYGIRESQLRHRIISEVKLKFRQNNTYSGTLKNNNPDAQGLRRVRYVNTAADKTNLITAEEMINNSNRAGYTLTLRCAGCHSDLLGSRAAVSDSVLGKLGDLSVKKVRYYSDGRGEYSEITLKKEKF